MYNQAGTSATEVLFKGYRIDNVEAMQFLLNNNKIIVSLLFEKPYN